MGYYPIGNFSHPFVYYRTLLDKEPHYEGQSQEAIRLRNAMGQSAEIYLTATELFGGGTPSHQSGEQRQNAAIDFLGRAAEFEKNKEQKLLNKALQKLDKNDPLRKKIEEINNSNDNKNDYLDFIIELNYLLQGREKTELFIKEELKRIKSRRDAYDKGVQAWKNSGKKGTQKEYLARAGYYNDYHTTTTRKKLSGQTTGNVGQATKQVMDTFQGIINNRTQISKLVDIILNRYGASLFNQNINNGFSFTLDERRSAALIQHLTTELNEMVLLKLIKNGLNLTDVKASTVPYNVDEIDLNALDDTFNEIKMGGIAMSNFLDSIAEQYGFGKRLDNGKREKEATSNQIAKFNKKLREIWKKSGSTDKFKDWRKNNSLSEENLKELIENITNFKIELYYQSEIDSAKNLNNNVISSIVVGGTGGKADVYSAGRVIVEIEEPEAREINRFLESEADKILPKLKELRKGYNGNTGLAKDLQDLNTSAQAIFDEWDNKVREIQAEVEETNQKYQEIYDLFSIDTSVKDYLSIGTTVSSFEGGSLGANLLEQVDKIGYLMNQGNIGNSAVDIMWLKTAIINTKPGLLGDSNRSKIEEYLAIFTGFLLFDDITTYIKDGLDAAVNSNVQRISLMDLNGTYVPLSYLLSGLHQALSKETESYKQYINVKIDNKYTLHKGNFEGSDGEWEQEANKAIENTKLVLTFMGKFTSLLRDLEERISQY